MSANNDVRNISDIHGILMTSAAVMVAEIGSIGQFSSAVKLQSYGGKSPNIAGSGSKIHSSGSSKIRNPHLSNSTYECAVSLVLHRSPEFLLIYQREIGRRRNQLKATES
ncbi:MAG: transposase [Candidatus Thermoplasmatota archaeon]|nr:transposase [Candidatus Thermoplasmatota archaeon]